MKEYEENDFIELDILIGRKRENERQDLTRKDTSGSNEESKHQNKLSASSSFFMGNARNDRQRSLSKSDSANLGQGEALGQGSFSMLHVQFSDAPFGNSANLRDEGSPSLHFPQQILRAPSQNQQSEEAVGLPMLSNTHSFRAISEDIASIYDNEQENSRSDMDVQRPYLNIDSSRFMDPLTYHDHRIEKAATLQFEGIQSRMIAVISKSLVMLKTSAGWDVDDEYRIVKLVKQKVDSQGFELGSSNQSFTSISNQCTQGAHQDFIGRRQDEPLVSLKEVCNLSVLLKGSKQLITAKEIMKGFVVVLCDMGKLILLQEIHEGVTIFQKQDTCQVRALPPQSPFQNGDPLYNRPTSQQQSRNLRALQSDNNFPQSLSDIRFIEHHSLNCQNEMATASITPIRERGGYFMLVGSRIQLFRIAKKEGAKPFERSSFQIIEIGRINQVIRSQPLHHSCQIISTATPYKIKFNFLILDRISQELIQVDLDFRKGRLQQRTILQRLMGSATPLSHDKRSFQAVLLDSRKDTIISYDVKRHAITHSLTLIKSKSIRINTCYFQIYKLFKMNHRLLMMIQHTRSVVVNLDNLACNEDTSLTFTEHDHSQRETITTNRDGFMPSSLKGSTSEPSYHMVCLNDEKKPRSDLTLWKVSSLFENQSMQDYTVQRYGIPCTGCQPDFQVNRESEPSFRACYLSDQLKEKIQTLPGTSRSHFPPYFDQEY